MSNHGLHLMEKIYFKMEMITISCEEFSTLYYTDPVPVNAKWAQLFEDTAACGIDLSLPNCWGIIGPWGNKYSANYILKSGCCNT